jgi:threonine/homoserine/homoserine lactone efflux protein
VILSADRFLAAMRGSRRLMRVFDYGFASLMGLFAGKLLLSVNR